MKNIVLYISCMLPVTKDTMRELTINVVMPAIIQRLEYKCSKVIFGND